MHEIRPRPFRSPGLSLLAVLAMGIGVGGVGGTVTLFRSYTRPLPVPEPDRLVEIARVDPREPDWYGPFLPEQLRDVRRGAPALQEIGAYRGVRHHLSGRDVAPISVRAGEMTAGTFRVLGVQPLLGRWFTEDDEEPGKEPSVILGHALWTSRFGGDREIVGRTIVLDGELTARVVGVMPPGFRFPSEHDLWLSVPRDTWTWLRHAAIGRLADGATLEQLNAQLAAVQPSPTGEEAAGPGTSLAARPYAERVYSPSILRSMRALMAGAVLVLVAACVNVATLLLVRALGRRRATAVRMALGAPRRVLVLERLVETSVLAALGGGVGLAVTWGMLRAAEYAFGPDPHEFWIRLGIDGGVFGAALAAIVAAALLAGVVPALRGTDVDVGAVLRASAPGASPRLGGSVRALVFVEVALSCMLLVAATGMMLGMRGSLFLGSAPVPPERVFMARYDLHPNRYPQVERRRDFHRRLEETLADHPAVAAVSFSEVVPAGAPSMGWYRLEVEIGGVPLAGGRRPEVRAAPVGPGYMDVLGGAVIRGRDFTWDDAAWEDDGPALLVTESFARRYLPDEDILGRTIRWGPDDERGVEGTVVGVVADVGLGAAGSDRAAMYLPYQGWSPVFAVLRAGGDAGALAPVVRDAVRSLDPEVPITEMGRLDRLVGELTRPMRILIPLFASFGLAAVLLTALGLHGVIAFSVGRRTREIAIRSAVGAGAARLAWLVLRGDGGRVMAGLVAGLVLAWLLLPAAGNDLLFDQDPRHPLLYAVAVAVVAGSALLAAAGPLVRALRVEVMEALRVE